MYLQISTHFLIFGMKGDAGGFLDEDFCLGQTFIFL